MAANTPHKAAAREAEDNPAQEEGCTATGNRRTVFHPADRLRDRIASIELVKNAGGDLTVLPTAGAVLGFQLRGHIRLGEQVLAAAGVTGIQHAARDYAYAANTATLLIRFSTQGAACLGVPVSELAGRSVALDDLLPRTRVSEVHERLYEAQTFAQAVLVLQQFFAALPFARDRTLERAFERLGQGGESNVAAVAKGLDISERQLERRMLERVGLTPKRYASLRRFERAVGMLRATESLAQVAQQAGYYDQSHFIREFRRLVGIAPGQYLRRTR